MVENPINRYAIGDRDPLDFNADGSLDIIIQHGEPEEGQANWLPAPDGIFVLNLRAYLPKASILSGEWEVPPIERL